MNTQKRIAKKHNSIKAKPSSGKAKATTVLDTEANKKQGIPGFTPLGFQMDLQTELGRFWMLFQLSTEPVLRTRVNNVNLILENIEDLHELPIEEWGLLVNHPKEVAEALHQESLQNDENAA